MALSRLTSRVLGNSRVLFATNNRAFPRMELCAVKAAFSSLARSPHTGVEEKGVLVQRLLHAKECSGKTYDELAAELGLTNAYVAQLFLNQAQLKPERVAALKTLVPLLSDEDLEDMQKCPYRAYDDTLKEEPLVYRLQEAVFSYGEGIKNIVNENFGDGIMSAIDVYVSVDKVKGSKGEDRVVVTFNGKFLPHIEQTAEAAATGKKK